MFTFLVGELQLGSRRQHGSNDDSHAVEVSLQLYIIS